MDESIYKSNFFIKAEKAEDDRFAPLPLALIQDEAFSDLSDSAKIVYAILKNRIFLSKKNGWKDEYGNAVIIFTQEEMSQVIHKQLSTVNRAYRELKSHHLISVRKRGRDKAAYIYLAQVSSAKKMMEIEKAKKEIFDKHCKNEMLDKHCKNEMLEDDNVAKMPRYIIDKKTEYNEETECSARTQEKKHPTLDEVVAYAKEKGASVEEAKRFFFYWDSLGWKRGKYGKRIQKWKSALAQWNLNKKRYGNEAKHESSSEGKYDGEFFKKLLERNRKVIMNEEEKDG